MNLLLDTHAFYWWLMDSPKLSPAASHAIAEPGAMVFVSAVTAFELAYKVRQGRWPEAAPIAESFIDAVLAEGFELLDLTGEHALRAGLLVAEHRDPFDRMLLAQAEIEGLVFVTADQSLQALAGSKLW